MSTAADAPTMKVMFVRGPGADADGITLQQLQAVAPELDVTTTQGSAEAIAEIRKSTSWNALLVSPSLPQNETLALIATLRRDRVPVAIVPVVDESRQDLFAAAVASGADDVLLRRGQTLVNVAETVIRMRQSPHLYPVDERRRVGVIYAGRDPLVWNLLEQVPFIRAERVAVGADGACPVHPAGAADAANRTDAVVIDEQPGDAHPLQVLKSVKAQASDLPVVLLTSSGTSDVATAALELGADDTVLKTGIFRRRLIATLRRVHQRLELTMQQAEMKAREERLRQIVENVPTGITVISMDGVVLAMNAAAIRLFGAAKPRDVVGRDFRQFVAPNDRESIGHFLRQVTGGETAAAEFNGHKVDGTDVRLTIRGVVLERDAKGTRGVIASVSPVASGQTSTADAPDRSELSSALDAMGRLEEQRAELTAARLRDQSAWNDERSQLEARVEAAERAAQLFDAERQELTDRIGALEAAARESQTAGKAHVELEAALELAAAEHRKVTEEHATAQAQWDATRAELESRLGDLERARMLEETRAAKATELERRLHEAIESLSAERNAAREARERLEEDLRAAREALWSEHAERDTLRATFDTDLSELRTILAAERTRWTEERAELEQHAETLRSEAELRLGAMADEHARAADAAREYRETEADALKTEVDSLRRALADAESRIHEISRQHAAALEEERSGRAIATQALDETRRALTEAEARASVVAEQHAQAVDALRVDHERSLMAEREARQSEATTLDAARRAWLDVEASLRAELADSRQAAAAERDRRVARETELETESLRSLTAERDEALRTLSALREERAALEARLVADLERAEEAGRATAEEYDLTRTRLQAERDELLRRVSELSTARTGLEQELEQIRFELGAHQTNASAAGEARVRELEAELARLHEEAAGTSALREAIARLEQQLNQAGEALDAQRTLTDQERRAFETERASLLRQLADQTAALEDRSQSDRALQALRSDYATMVHALEGEREGRQRERARIAALETLIEQAQERQAALERDLANTRRDAEAIIRQRETENAEHTQALERELSQSSMRLSRVVEEADRARAALHAEFTRAAESHHRLIASDLFGYAVTTLSGELVRCNDAFARLFGFADAPDAMTHTAGRTIPGLADRPALVSRLAAEGQVARLEACLERADGQPIRVAQSATLLSDPADADAETLVEHVLLGRIEGHNAAELRAERLEAVGALASEMAPEMEALVTTLHEHLTDADRDRRSLTFLAAQVAALVRQLGAFSRRQMLPTARIDLSQAVLAAEPTLIRLVGDYIGFSTDLEETAAVPAHVDDLDHLLTSLVTLARDLLPTGGSVLVETRSAGRGQDRDDEADGPRLTVSASGYGVQIPERSSALDQVVERAGAQLRIHGEPGWIVRLDVTFPICGKRRARQSWSDPA